MVWSEFFSDAVSLHCDFPEIITFQLTINHCSSSNIVKVTSMVLRKVPYNWKRGLTNALILCPQSLLGKPIHIQILPSPIAEARFIETKIQRLVKLKTNLTMRGSFEILFHTHV